MRYLKYLLIVSLMSILFSEDEIIAKVYFKDGSYKIGYIDENYSESQIKLVTLDGDWTLYLKQTINDIEYGGFDVKSTLRKDSNTRTMISFGSADINGLEGQSSIQSFKYAFYTKKNEKTYNGFSISGWDDTKNNHRYIKYLLGYSHLKFKNDFHKGFYYSIDAGIQYSTVCESEETSLFGVSPCAILSIIEDLIEEPEPSYFGIGTNITTGYSFQKIMISYSLSLSLFQKSFEYDGLNIMYPGYSSINISYLL